MDTDTPPFTPEEVEKMFRTVMQRGQHPDMKTCEQVARILRRWQQGGDFMEAHLTSRSPVAEVDVASATRRDRWDKAAGTLRALMKQRRAEMGEVGRWPVAMELAMAELEGSLSQAQDWFGWGRMPAPKGKEWHRPAFHIMDMAVCVVSWFRPRQGGDGRKSSAAHFTELAIARLGLDLARGQGQREAIAIMFERWTKSQAKSPKAVSNDHKA